MLLEVTPTNFHSYLTLLHELGHAVAQESPNSISMWRSNCGLENYRLQLHSGGNEDPHSFHALVSSYFDLEKSYWSLKKAVGVVQNNCKKLEGNFWLYEDKLISSQNGVCLDGSPVQSAVQSYQVVSVNPASAQGLSENIHKLHSLCYSNLLSVDTMCEIWAQLVKSRCVDMVEHDKAGFVSVNDHGTPTPGAAIPLYDWKEHLDVLLYFIKITPITVDSEPNWPISKATSDSAPVSPLSTTTETAPLDTSNFLACVHWSINYLVKNIMIHSQDEQDLIWLLDRFIHLRGLPEWGQDFLSIPGLLKMRPFQPSDSPEVKLKIANQYVNTMRRVLSPILGPHAPVLMPQVLKANAAHQMSFLLSGMNSESYPTSPSPDTPTAPLEDDDLFVLSETDFISLLSHMSLGSFLASWVDPVLLEAKTRYVLPGDPSFEPGKKFKQDDEIEWISKTASTLSVFEELVQVLSSAIPFFTHHYLDCAKKVSDMLVKCANRAMKFVQDLLTTLSNAPPRFSAAVYSKAEEIATTVFDALLSEPKMWQFLVHLDFSKLSLQTCLIFISTLYFSNPSSPQLDIPNLSLENWSRAVYQNPSMRDVMVGRLVSNPTSDYLIYTIYKLLATHMEHQGFLQIMLFELFTLAYLTEETLTLQKLIRDSALTLIISTQPSLISTLMFLTDASIGKPYFDCFHPWKELNLATYDLPPSDVPILRKWLVSNPDTSPQHHLAKYICASIITNPTGAESGEFASLEASSSAQKSNSVEPSLFVSSGTQRRLAYVVLSAHQEFVYPSTLAPADAAQGAIIKPANPAQSQQPPRSAAAIATFTQFCCSILLRTFHHDYTKLTSNKEEFEEAIVTPLARTFASCLSTPLDTVPKKGASITLNEIDPVTAFGIVEFTSLAGDSPESLWSKSGHTGIDDVAHFAHLSIDAFFGCGVPVLRALLSASNQPQMSSRLLFDTTILVAPFITMIKQFLEPIMSSEEIQKLPPGDLPPENQPVDWSKSETHCALSQFSNHVVLPFMQIPSLISSVASSVSNLVRGPSPVDETAPPSLGSLISAQYALCLRADMESNSFSASQHIAPSQKKKSSQYQNSAFSYGGFDGVEDEEKPMYPNLAQLDPQMDSTSASRTSSLLAFWLESLLLITDWYKIPTVLKHVEIVFQLMSASSLHSLAVNIATQCEKYELAILPKKSSATQPFPLVLTTLLGSIAQQRGFISNLFSNQKADEIPYPWTTVFFMQSYAQSINLESVAAAVSSTLAPGQPSPLSMSSHKTALAPLQPLFEAVTRALLVVDPSHGSSLLYWNIFANLYFANCLTAGGQSLFYGHTLFQTSTSKSRREKVKARLSLFISHFTAASSPSNDQGGASNQDPMSLQTDQATKVQLRELFSSFRVWLSVDVYKFVAIPALLADMPMSNWLTPIVMGPANVAESSKFAWAQLSLRFIPLFEGFVTTWASYMLLACQQHIPVVILHHSSKSLVDLADVMKGPGFGVERIESLRQLRKAKKDAHSSDLTESGEVRMVEHAKKKKVSLASSDLFDRTEYKQFDLNHPEFLEDMDTALRLLKSEASSFNRRRQVHWSYLDRRIQILHILRRNQEQLALAKAPCNLREQCKGPAEFRVNLSRIVIDGQADAELKANSEMLIPLVNTVKSRNQEMKANAVAFRFLRTMFSIFGGGDGRKPLKDTLKPPQWAELEEKLVNVYWKLREYHSNETTTFPPALQVFNLLERQLMSVVVSKANQVGKVLYSLVEDPWASAAFKTNWSSEAATPWERFHMLEYLWTRPLPTLLDTSRAALLGSIDINALFAQLDSDEAKKDIMGRLSTMLKNQIIMRSNKSGCDIGSPAHIASLKTDIQDPLFTIAVTQLGILASIDFPTNLGAIFQFVLDESRKRDIHPSVWDAVLTLPYAPSATHPGLTYSKLQSILTFLSSYMEMFIKNHPTTHLNLWSPYMPKFLLLLKQLGYSLVHHLHAEEKVSSDAQNSEVNSGPNISDSPTPSISQPPHNTDVASDSFKTITPSPSSDSLPSVASTSTPVMSPSSSYSQLPIPARASLQDVNATRGSPATQKSKADHYKILASFLDLYSKWILIPSHSVGAELGSIPKPEAHTFEVWDNEMEGLALMVADSLQHIMYYIIVGPEAFTVPGITFARRYRLEVLTNVRLPQLFSLQSVPILQKVAEYLTKFALIPSLPEQRCQLLTRASFQNLPFTYLLNFPAQYLSLLQAMYSLAISVREKPNLFRYVNQLLMNMVPEMMEDYSNPFLTSSSLDNGSLSIILNFSIVAVSNLPLPYEQEEIDFWRRMVFLLPWVRLEPSSLPALPSLNALLSRLPNSTNRTATAKSSVLHFVPTTQFDPISELVASQYVTVPVATNQPQPQALRKNAGWDMTSVSGNSFAPVTGTGGTGAQKILANVGPPSISVRALTAIWLFRTLAGWSSSPDPQHLPYVITLQGVLENYLPRPEDWKTPDQALRTMKLTSRVIELQNLLLPLISSLDDPDIWNSGGYLTPLLRYIGNVSNLLSANPDGSNNLPPISANVRSYLQEHCQILPGVPDSFAYPVLWTHILTTLSKAAFSAFWTFANFSRSTSPAASSEPLATWELKFIEATLTLHRDAPALTPLLISAVFASVSKMSAAAALLDGILKTDWSTFRSMPRMVDILVLPPPEAQFNFPLLRQSLYKSNSVVSLLTITSQILHQYHEKKQPQQTILENAASVAPLLQLEPELQHWASSLLISPGQEYELLGLWMKISQVYIEMIMATSVSVSSALGLSSLASAPSPPYSANSSPQSSMTASTTPRKLDLPARLLNVAKVMYAKSESKVESDSSLLRMFGVKKSSSLPAPFRIGSQLLALFLFEHLLETPVLGPGNKVVGYNVTLRNHNSYAIIDPAQEKRKQVLLESVKKPPASDLSSAVSAAISHISRPQKSLADMNDIWGAICPLFTSQQSEMLFSLVQN